MAHKWGIADHASDYYPEGAEIYFDPDDEDNKERIENGYNPWVDWAVFPKSPDEVMLLREQLEDEDLDPEVLCPNGIIDPEGDFWVAVLCG